MTKADKAADQAAEIKEPEVKRRKLGRGSARRITRAIDALDAAMTTFIKDMDFDVFLVDDEGVRVGRWPVLDDLEKVKTHVRAEVGYVLDPESRPTEDEASAETT